MNLLKISLLGLFMTAFISCDSDDAATNIFGVWELESVKINGVDSTDAQDLCEIGESKIEVLEGGTEGSGTFTRSFYENESGQAIKEADVEDTCELDYIEGGTWVFDGTSLDITNDDKRSNEAVVVEADESFSYSNGKFSYTETSGEDTTVVTYVKSEKEMDVYEDR